MKTLRVNGEEKSFDGDAPGTLLELLEKIGLEPATVVAEIDGAIIERARFGQTAINDGQKIELVRFVGGG
jgi:sulfur carrier protein